MFSSLSINDISVAVATEEFLTVSDWTASKLGNFSEVLKSSNFNNKPISQKRSSIQDMHDDYNRDSAWHQNQINELYNDYHKNPTQYQNHTIYECLKTYMDPFNWRPTMLILISSDTVSFPHLNNSVLLQWEVIQPGPDSQGHPLCDRSPNFWMKCGSFESFNSENIGTYIYRGNKIDYALYKDMDPVQPKMKTCYLQGSPQILMGMYAL